MTPADAFSEYMKMMNHTWLWDAELIWYSLHVTYQIYLYVSENGFGIHDFCWIIKILATQAKFLSPTAFTVLWSLHLLHYKCFWLFPLCYVAQFKSWTTLVTWYIHYKLAYGKIWWNFWFTLVLFLMKTEKIQSVIKYF